MCEFPALKISEKIGKPITYYRAVGGSENSRELFLRLTKGFAKLWSRWS